MLFAVAWAVKGLWNSLRTDIAWLPALTYRRALALVVLWGLLFVVVLAMIVGARELMTPGAWRKHGWTYKLADESNANPSSSTERRHALEGLRQALWHYAAIHEGRFPLANDPAIDKSLWEIPGWPGLHFLYVPNRHAGPAGQLLIYEPELDDDGRLVVLTNGMIGTMRDSEIQSALPERFP